MVGTYHQFGAFVSGVASLPRVVIMTLHDIPLRPVNADKDPAAAIRPNSSLAPAGPLQTYHYPAAATTAPAPAPPPHSQGGPRPSHADQPRARPARGGPRHPAPPPPAHRHPPT